MKRSALLLSAGAALALLASPPSHSGAQARRPAVRLTTRDAAGFLVDTAFGPAVPAEATLSGPVRLSAGLPPALASRLAALTAIAQGYAAWGAVDDQARWAPFDCRLPLPPAVHASEAPGRGSHEGKLYRLFASSSSAYRAATAPGVSAAPEGLVVVKESFHAVPFQGAAPASLAESAQRSRLASRGGRLYTRGDFAGLFVMARLGGRAQDTDDGWLYATVAPTGEVTAAGRVAQCMGCHERAPHGRLFGAVREL